MRQFRFLLTRKPMHSIDVTWLYPLLLVPAVCAQSLEPGPISVPTAAIISPNRALIAQRERLERLPGVRFARGASGQLRSLHGFVSSRYQGTAADAARSFLREFEILPAADLETVSDV